MSQTDEPLVEEDEEQHKTGRSAFFAGVNRADTFSGAFRGVPATKHGGAQTVKPEDTIGNPDCWCGQVYGHDWAGKSRGAKHPRGDQVSAMADEKPYLNPRDLKSWDRKVVRALCELVNTYGVRYRIDASAVHIYLYAPGQPEDDVATKFKAARSRGAEQQLFYIEKWATQYIRPVVTEDSAKALAAKLNDPSKKPHVKPAKKAVAAVPTPAPKVSQIESSQASQGFQGSDEDLVWPDEAPEGYHQHIPTRGGDGASNWWEKDGGGHWICKHGDFETDKLQGGGAHQRMHTMTGEARSEISSKAAESNDRELQARRTKARNAIKFLASEYDIALDTGKAKPTLRLERRIEILERELAKVTAERDEIKTKFDLAREAFGL